MYKKILILMLALLIIPMVMAQPPFQESDSACFIESPVIENIKLGQNYDLHAHVVNATTGGPMNSTNLNCITHLYNHTGNHLFKSGLMGYDNFDFEVNIAGTNFSFPGQYSVLIQCYGGMDPSDPGCIFEYPVYVTDSGHDIKEYSTWSVGILLVLFGLVSVFFFFAFKTEQVGYQTFFLLLGFIFLFVLSATALIMSRSTVLYDELSVVLVPMTITLGILLILVFFLTFVNVTKDLLNSIYKKKGHRL